VVGSIAPSTPPTRRLPPAWTSPVGTVEPAVETEAVAVAAAAAAQIGLAAAQAASQDAGRYCDDAAR